MEPRNPRYREKVAEIFNAARFVGALGLELSDMGPGWCASSLTIRPEHLQQDGYVHAGVQATMADHTAGAAAGTLCGADELVLTSGFSIQLLRPAVGERLRCRANVLKAGKTVTVAESEVYARGAGPEKLVAKATVSLVLVPGRAT